MSKKETAIKRCALYCRVSKEDKNHQSISIDQQVSDGMKLAKNKGWTLKKEHILLQDRNKSGKLPPRQWLPPEQQASTNYREDFTRLIDLITNNEIDVVIVRKLDRLNRSMANQTKLYELMTKCGVTIAATHESLPTAMDASGLFTMSLLAAVAQFELQKTVENIRAAKVYAKQNDLKMSSGKNCAGYTDGEKGKVIIDDKARPAIIKLFELFAEGHTLSDIANYLNTHFKGTHSCLGEKWHHSSIKKVVQSPRYIGKRFNDKGELIPTQVYPPIIDELLWMKCHERLRIHNKANKHASRTICPASGIVKCGYCNKPMILYSRYNKSSVKIGREFKCLTRHDASQRPSGLQEDALLELADSLIWVAVPPSETHTKSSEESNLEIQANKIHERLNELPSAIAHGMSFALATESEKMLRQILQGVENKLSILHTERISIATRNKVINTIVEGKKTNLSPSELQQAIKSTIRSIHIFANHAEVQMVPPDAKTLEEIYALDKLPADTIQRGSKNTSIKEYRNNIRKVIANPAPFFLYTFPIMLRQDPSYHKSRPKHCFFPKDFKINPTVLRYHLVTDRTIDWSNIIAKGYFWHRDPKLLPKVKQCTHCGKAKPLEDFIKVQKNRDGRHGRCRSCDITYRAKMEANRKLRQKKS